MLTINEKKKGEEGEVSALVTLEEEKKASMNKREHMLLKGRGR